MPRPKKRDPNQPKLTKRQRALLEVLVAYDNLRRTDIVDELNALTEMGLIEFDYEGPSEPTAAGRALVQVPNVEPETRDYKRDAAELAGAVIGFIDMLDHVTNDQAYLLQFAKDVLAGKPVE